MILIIIIGGVVGGLIGGALIRIIKGAIHDQREVNREWKAQRDAMRD